MDIAKNWIKPILRKTECEGAANGRLTPLQPIAQFYIHTAGKYICKYRYRYVFSMISLDRERLEKRKLYHMVGPWIIHYMMLNDR